jgi:O-antigen/teichoic acid export membrane protein
MARGSIVAVGVAGSQVIGLLSLPFLARMFNPDEFGLYGSFFMGSQFLATILALRYEQAIFICEESERDHALVLCILVSCATSIALCAVSALCWLFGIITGPVFLLTVVCGFLTSVSTTLIAYAVTTDRYIVVSGSRLVRAIVSVVSQVLLQYSLGIGLMALVAGEIFAALVTTVILMGSAVRDLKDPRSLRCCFAKLRSIAWRFRDQPIWNLPQTASNGVSRWATLLLINALFTSAEAGQFFFMQRIILAPSVFIAGALSQVYLRSASQQRRESGTFWDTFFPLTAMLIFIGALIAVAFSFGGKWFFSALLGPEWRLAGEMAQVFSVYALFHVVLSVLGPTTIIAGRQKTMLYVTLGQTAAFLIPLTYSGFIGSSLVSGLSVTVLSSVIYMLCMLMWYVQLARVCDKKVEV